MRGPFTRYVVSGPGGFHWWNSTAKPYLERKGWYVLDPTSFRYEDSYGFDPKVYRSRSESLKFDYLLHNASAVVEYQGEAPRNSIFRTGSNWTLIDDLLVFLSLYTGVYCQYVWKEQKKLPGGWEAVSQVNIRSDAHNHECAGGFRQVSIHFDKAISVIPNLNQTQITLGVNWMLSGLREFEVGRPLVESALNWVCLECQANLLYYPSEKNDFKRVERLLSDQGFSDLPKLGKLYGLRSNAFHQGKLITLPEADAQKVRSFGRALVRAQMLNLMGMDQSDFSDGFKKLYTT